MKNIWIYLRYDLPLHFILLWTNWLPDNVIFLRFRGCLVKPFFAACGKNLRLGRHVLFNNPANITIGNNVYFAYGCWVSARGEITFSDDVTIGPYCAITSSNHKRIGDSYSNEEAIIEPIEVGNGCWLGAHCVVTAGTKIGDGSVLGAGAVVVKNIPGNVLATGVPARPIRKLGGDEIE